MKLRYGAASPFARKCALSAHVLGLADRITPSASLLDTLPPLVGLLLARHVGRVEVGV